MIEVAESPRGDRTTPVNGDELAVVAAAVRMALEKTGHGWLRRIVVALEGENIVLRGTLPSFYLKQMAQVTVLAVPGIPALWNELVVEGGHQ